MKWAIFAIALVAVIPLSQWLRQNPRHTLKVWILFGLLPSLFNPHFSAIDWSGWIGYVFGLQVTGLDLLALAFLIARPHKSNYVPFRFVFALYIFAVTLSVFHAAVPMAAIFYVWQLARIFFVYVVVARASSDERVPTAILTGMSIGLCFQAALAIWQRFGQGVLQAGGFYGNQNLLGLASEFAMFPLFALLLAGKRGWPNVVGPLAGIIIAVLTTSRAAVGLGAIGFVLVFTLSSLYKWTTRKASFLFAGLVAITILTPFVVSSFEKRFATNPITIEYDERAAFNRAAALILGDHPYGIGANNYVIVANSGGYLDRADVPWGGGQRESVVHNAYWLAAAETGYLGVFAFVLLTFRIILSIFRCSWKNRNDPRSSLMLGLGVSLLIVALHNNYEWVFYLYDVQYLFAMTAGMAAGQMELLGYWRNKNRALAVSRRQFPNVAAPGSNMQHKTE